jgi:hypothetical protein
MTPVYVYMAFMALMIVLVSVLLVRGYARRGTHVAVLALVTVSCRWLRSSRSFCPSRSAVCSSRARQY